MASLLGVYHRLPACVRSPFASLRGYYLSWWRYGPETERLVEEALAREAWTPAQWEKWASDQLARLLHHAATRVPYYREFWAGRRREGGRLSWELLANWPVLAKEELRRNPAAFLADDCRPSRMFVTHTSGTTGTPLRLYQSRAAIRAWYALSEARWRRWYGLTRGDRWAILGGQLVTPAAQRTPPFWVRNRGLNQLYLSAYHLAPDLIPHYVNALREFAPVYLLGYSSALHVLAGECLRQGVTDLRFKTVLTNAEPLYEHQRETISRAFQCPVRETYGMSEKAAGASECDHGRLHLWPDAGVAEIESPDETGAGELLVTGLLNRDMPLIRYRVGDRARLAQEMGVCACGRSLPVLESVEGRSDDVLLTPDGRRIGRLDPVFKGELGIREALIIQEEVDRVRVVAVPAAGFGVAQEQQLRALLRARLGPAMRVEIETAASIARGPNGKFRAVISRLPAGSALPRT